MSCPRSITFPVFFNVRHLPSPVHLAPLDGLLHLELWEEVDEPLEALLVPVDPEEVHLGRENKSWSALDFWDRTKVIEWWSKCWQFDNFLIQSWAIRHVGQWHETVRLRANWKGVSKWSYHFDFDFFTSDIERKRNGSPKECWHPSLGPNKSLMN